MDMLYWARGCASVGLRVHPLYEVDEDLVCQCHAGAECSEKQRGKHPRLGGWQQKATTDGATIDEWWKRWPDAGIGIATGKASRVWVLDLDGEQAIAWWTAKVREHGKCPTRGSKTGRGRHLWWEWPEDDTIEIVNSGGTVAPGVDVRGDGGYVIAPPTMHRSGVRYEWLTSGPYAEETATAPEWLLELVKKEPKPPAPAFTVPKVVTPRELKRVFSAAVDNDPDVRRRIGERAGGRYREASRSYVDQIRCPACGRSEVWFYVDSGPAVCHHRNSCKWAGPLTKLLE